tara:strand:+ start:160 stop:696 length:537 start_codon:yes stop_codon:yes gene_type:complete
VEFLIDKDFWDNLIKKAPPTMALEIKNGLQKNSYGRYDLRENCVLKLPKKIISYGFCKALINKNYSSRYESYKWKESLLSGKRRNIKKISSFEILILEVLIESQGLSNEIKYIYYKNWGADQGELVKIFSSDQTPSTKLAELAKKNNLVLEIERLANLRERGLLTDQEFNIAKRKLLS